jgi:hypothetical protein
MLVAIKTKRITKLSVLNSKKEKIILNIPSSEWVVIENINSPNLLLNKEAIISEGGQVYSSLWRSDPPFGEKVKFMRSGFSTTTDATYSEIKSVSKDAILEFSTEVAESYDTILQDVEIEEYIDSIRALAESATNKMADLKSAYVSKKIEPKEFKAKSEEAFTDYIEAVAKSSSAYFLDVFEVSLGGPEGA